MKILITGAHGQLGQCLKRQLIGHELEAHDQDTLDLVDHDSVSAKFQEFNPDVVINAAAYTAVDKAEQEPDLADLINHRVVRNLAEECDRAEAKLIQISTDFVFDGQQSHPYSEDDICKPISVYGQTKRDAELAIQEVLPNDHIIIRTAWLYSQYGNNFVKTMLRLMSEREELSVVCDQVGTPTSAMGLAEVISKALAHRNSSGMYHWTDAGVASWYDFAVAIYEEATSLGLLTSSVSVLPIHSSQYPTPAQRPAFSVLDKAKSYAQFGVQILHWREQLRKVLAQINQTG